MGADELAVVERVLLQDVAPMVLAAAFFGCLGAILVWRAASALLELLTTFVRWALRKAGVEQKLERLGRLVELRERRMEVRVGQATREAASRAL
ncbi:MULTISPECIES: hypothetical protein [unclassified Leifsonia]|uniref:hypothetical protein n=1 Tax=unclassified Leifsonia TaxID=2663824 RepID=UPI0008A7AFDF|nr:MULTISPECIES: hypothetical protein [unclassified Leifsonia]SEH83995.1 hypothetical protein SAMN04515694_10532 [Leifsonia sp. CL154]SFL46622.1 hypothetical protein SAMN04515692_10531 [Leifsonia sp. CL147]